jgi:transaldolase
VAALPGAIFIGCDVGVTVGATLTRFGLDPTGVSCSGFSSSSPVYQALLAAKAGASFISPFVGRLDDIAQDGMDLIREIREIYDNYPHLKTEILVASVRHPRHVVDSARIGADVVTLPPDVLRKLALHPLTDKGLETFMADWKKTGQTILG